jgi:3-deoxy-D-manno-octulosonate 8-phosphate phosphatase (KDO 8-P phosphatase)
MSGINYDLKKIRGIVFDVDGVLSPSTIPMGEDGQPVRMVNIKDGYAIQLAAKNGYKMAIITGGKQENIRLRYEALGLKDIYIGASQKYDIFISWMKKEGLTAEEVIYMGDDIPDLHCMRAAGLPIAPNDAAWEAKEEATYISRFNGGYGCARDVLEQVMKAQGCWMKDDNAFGW